MSDYILWNTLEKMREPVQQENETVAKGHLFAI